MKEIWPGLIVGHVLFRSDGGLFCFSFFFLEKIDVGVLPVNYGFLRRIFDIYSIWDVRNL